MKAIFHSLMMLGLISLLLMGAAQTGGAETNWMMAAGETEELRGTEFPFPVGWVPESEAPGTESRDSYILHEAAETGALPGTVMPADELRGTEFPFPVGFVPEGKE